MYIRSRLFQLGGLLTMVVLFGGAAAPVAPVAAGAPGGLCRRGDPETVLMGNVHLPEADASDRVVEQALDLLEPFIHVRPHAGTVRASDYPDLPLTGLAGFRVCVVATGVIAPEIYINTETNMYKLAADHSLVGLVALAATLVHEIEHGKPANEAQAYGAETAFVRHWVRTQPAASLDRRVLERFLAALEHTTRELRHGGPGPAEQK